jgi:cytochrome c oxidase cbb3-type subunit 3
MDGLLPSRKKPAGKGAVLTILYLLLWGAPIEAAAPGAESGKKLYRLYCTTCHGDGGRGDGLAARSLPVKPANHADGEAMRKLSDQFLFDIIAGGGPAVGKSVYMPAWRNHLNEAQIQQLVDYIRGLPPTKPPPRL